MDLNPPQLEIATVYTEVGYAKVKCSPDTTVRDIIKAAVHTVSVVSPPDQYAIQVKTTKPDDRCSGRVSFCPEMKWSDLKVAYPSGEFCLTVQIFPQTMDELFRKDKATLLYLKDQIRREYFSKLQFITDSDRAFEIGCYEIRENLKRNDNISNDKKSAIESIEKSKGFSQFFPPCVLDAMKTKILRKSIIQYLQKISDYAEDNSAVELLNRFLMVLEFDRHVIQCLLGAGWGISVDLIIGPRYQISIKVENARQATLVAYFASVRAIQVEQVTTGPTTGITGDRRCHVKVYLEEGDPINFTFESHQNADFAAHLIDAYCRAGTGGHSETDFLVYGCLNNPRVPLDNETNDNPSFDPDDYGEVGIAENFEIKRSCVNLEQILGEGMFADVYKGTYRTRHDSVPVAVKISKEEGEREKFLDEANTMGLFDHPQIIKLIGICSDSPVWIVMEYAPLGEMRSYLMENKPSLTTSQLVMYCYQISTALSYLETRKYVHRDIAARNVLVSTPECVKLADFGMARWLEENNFYTAGAGVLPIKWMAPESYNYRKFSSASDVWMFAICMWEILSLGIKPFEQLKNQEAVERIERGERLLSPDKCPPALYRLMLDCWNYNPAKRPTFAVVKRRLYEISREVKRPLGGDDDKNVRKGKTVSWTGDDHSENNDGAPPPKPNLPMVSVNDMSDLIQQSMPDLHQATGPPVHLAREASPSRTLERHKPTLTRSSPFQPAGRRETPLPPVPKEADDEPRTPPGPRSLNTPSSGLSLSRTVPTHLSQGGGSTPGSRNSSPKRGEGSGSLPDLLVDEGKKPKKMEDILLRQKEQSREDSQWLEKTEQRLMSGVGDAKKSSPPATSTEKGYFSAVNRENSQIPKSDQSGSVDTGMDPVYQATTCLVKAVAYMSKQVVVLPPEKYKDLVKNIGEALKGMLQAIQDALGERPPDDAVTLSTRQLNSDMFQLIKSARVAEQFANAPFLPEYQKLLLGAAHTLAVDAKSVYEVVSKDLVKSPQSPASS